MKYAGSSCLVVKYIYFSFKKFSCRNFVFPSDHELNKPARTLKPTVLSSTSYDRKVTFEYIGEEQPLTGSLSILRIKIVLWANMAASQLPQIFEY